MSTREEIEEVYNNTKYNPIYKRAIIASIISRELGKIGIRPIVVGGSAVEIYANDLSRYATQDIDMVLTRTDRVSDVMKNIGFTSEGGVWFFGDTDIIIEFPKGPLAGSWDKLITYKVRHDCDDTVTYLGLEDVIIDRCNDYKAWGTEKAAVAKVLISAYYNTIDFHYLRERAKEELCYDIVKRFIKEHKIKINKISEENPKRQQYFSSKQFISSINLFKKGIPHYGGTKTETQLLNLAKPLLKKTNCWNVNTEIILINELKNKHISDNNIRELLFFSPNGYGLEAEQRLQRAQNMLRRYQRYQKNGKLKNIIKKRFGKALPRS